MIIFALTFSLLANVCQAADNSNNRSLNANLDLNTNVASLQEFQKYVDIDPKEYFADLKSKLVPIEAASRMSRVQLDSLENISSASYFRATAPCNQYVHNANSHLARLFKMRKPPKVQQATFDAWKNSGLSAIKFMDLVKESKPHFPDGEHCKRLADFASIWHLSTGRFLKMNGEDSQEGKYHIAQWAAINFLFFGLVHLNASDSVEFEECIKAESFEGICSLAKKVLSSDQYSRTVLGDVRMTTSSNVATKVDKIVQLTNGFNRGIRLAWEEDNLQNVQAKLKSRGIDFDVKSAVNSNDPKEIIKAYEQCISRAADLSTKNRSVHVVQIIWDITSIESDLKTLQNLFNKSRGPVYNKSSFRLRNVVEPALILINSKRIIEDLVNDDFAVKLKDYGIELRNVTLDQMTSLRGKDEELYNRLFLVQKSRDYLEHIDDIAYIRKDFDEMANVFKNRKRFAAYQIVNEVVQELKNDTNNQMCSFDLIGGKLVCNSSEMLELLVKIQKKEFACNILIDFCKNAISEQSLPIAIANFEGLLATHRNAYLSKYSGVDRLKPNYVLIY